MKIKKLIIQLIKLLIETKYYQIKIKIYKSLSMMLMFLYYFNNFKIIMINSKIKIKLD